MSRTLHCGTGPVRLVLALGVALLLTGCAEVASDDVLDDDPETPGVRTELVADGFDAPLDLANAGDGSDRLFVVERGGAVRVIRDGSVQEAPYLDVAHLLAPPQGENGLLGLAFHPGFAENGRLFVHYVDEELHSVVAELRAEPPSAETVDAGTLVVLLREAPASAIHQGGEIAFGPDGHLYVALGDGGEAATAQDLTTLHGSILRLDVGAPGGPYAVPQDNPFAIEPGARGEIWASGLRNPWRFSFDPATGDLWIADVGQNAVEEINLQPAASAGGENYGWPIMEGDRCHEPPEGCDTAGLTLPVVTYDHADGWGRAVIGGAVYRGADVPHLVGAYLFADYVSGSVFAARPDDDGWVAERILETPLAIASLGVDEGGEHYLVDFAGGTVHRLVAEE